METANSTEFPREKLHVFQIKDKYAEEPKLETELFTSKEHFSKLKFNYLELETKRHFFDYIANKEWSPEKMSQLQEQSDAEQSMSEMKQKVALVKEENESTEKYLVGMAKEVLEMYNKLQEEEQQLKQQAQIESQDQGAEHLKEEVNSLSSEKSKLEEELSSLNDQLVSLQEQQEEIASSSNDNSPNSSPSNSHNNNNNYNNNKINDITELQHQLNELEDEYQYKLQYSETNREAASSISDLNNWHSKVTALLSKMSGVQIQAFRNQHLSLNMTSYYCTHWPPHSTRDLSPLDVVQQAYKSTHNQGSVNGNGNSNDSFYWDTKDHEIQLLFDHETGRLTDVKIIPDDVTLSDEIIMQAIDTNDVCFLLRELRTRISNAETVRQEVIGLQRHFDMDFDEEMGVVKVIYGRNGEVMVELYLGENYPLIYPVINVAKVISSTLRGEAVTSKFESIKTRAQQNVFTSLKDVISFVESCLQEYSIIV